MREQCKLEITAQQGETDAMVKQLQHLKLQNHGIEAWPQSRPCLVLAGVAYLVLAILCWVCLNIWSVCHLPCSLRKSASWIRRCES